MYIIRLNILPWAEKTLSSRLDFSTDSNHYRTKVIISIHYASAQSYSFFSGNVPFQPIRNFFCLIVQVLPIVLSLCLNCTLARYFSNNIHIPHISLTLSAWNNTKFYIFKVNTYLLSKNVSLTLINFKLMLYDKYICYISIILCFLIYFILLLCIAHWYNIRIYVYYLVSRFRHFKLSSFYK